MVVLLVTGIGSGVGDAGVSTTSATTGGGSAAGSATVGTMATGALAGVATVTVGARRGAKLTAGLMRRRMDMMTVCVCV